MKKYYSTKYPLSSEYSNGLLTQIIFAIFLALLAVIYFSNYKLDTFDSFIKSILIWPIIYLALACYNKIHRINMLIIKIENLFKDNSILSKQIDDNSNKLLLCDVSYNLQRKKESKIILIFIIALMAYIVMLKYFHGGGILFFFYSAWVLILLLIISFFFSAGNVFRFFIEVNTSCSHLIPKIKDDLEATCDKKYMTILAEFIGKRNKCLLIGTMVSIVSVFASLIFVEFRDAARSVSILIVLVLLRIVMVDVDDVVKFNLKELGNYDEYTKAKLGFEYKNIKSTDFSPYLSDNIKYLVESNKFLLKDMFDAVKETTRELLAAFKKNKKT